MKQEDLHKALSNLGFKHQGDFEPIEFDADDFDNICEIGSWIVAIQKEYIALLFYSEMVYWDIAESSIETILKAIEIISEYELKRHTQRQQDAVINVKKKSIYHD
jgi:hypothetical protein